MIGHHPLRRSLLTTVAYLLAAMTLNELRRRHVVSTEMVERQMGMMGTVVLVSANAIPERLVPLPHLSCDPAREQALRRFCGWVLVVGGLGYTLSFAVAPVEIAATVAICLLAPAAIAMVGVAACGAWKRRDRR